MCEESCECETKRTREMTTKACAFLVYSVFAIGASVSLMFLSILASVGGSYATAQVGDSNNLTVMEQFGLAMMQIMYGISLQVLAMFIFCSWALIGTLLFKKELAEMHRALTFMIARKIKTMNNRENEEKSNAE